MVIKPNAHLETLASERSLDPNKYVAIAGRNDATIATKRMIIACRPSIRPVTIMLTIIVVATRKAGNAVESAVNRIKLVQLLSDIVLLRGREKKSTRLSIMTDFIATPKGTIQFTEDIWPNMSDFPGMITADPCMEKECTRPTKRYFCRSHMPKLVVETSFQKLLDGLRFLIESSQRYALCSWSRHRAVILVFEYIKINEKLMMSNIVKLRRLPGVIRERYNLFANGDNDATLGKDFVTRYRNVCDWCE